MLTEEGLLEKQRYSERPPRDAVQHARDHRGQGRRAARVVHGVSRRALRAARLSACVAAPNRQAPCLRSGTRASGAVPA
jgi:hypothetical protein